MNFDFLRPVYQEEEGGEGGTGGANNDAAFETLAAQVADLTEQLGKVNGKNEELLTEKKMAQKARDEAKAEAQRKADEKALAAGDHKQLL